MLKKLSPQFFYLLLSYFGLIVLFGIFRLIFIADNIELLLPEGYNYLYFALFNRGLLFDVMAAGYIFFLPFLVWLILYTFNVKSIKAYRLVHYLILIIITIAVIISIIDLPFFRYYNARINKSILMWTDDFSSMVKVIFTDATYLKSYLIIAMILAVVYWLYGKLYKQFQVRMKIAKKTPLVLRLVTFLTIILGLMISIRGEYSTKKMPTVIEHAFETPIPFINLLGMNAFHSFVNSFENKKFAYLDDDKAIENTRQFLNRDKIIDGETISREIMGNTTQKKLNVVLVLMESMSANKMSYYDHAKGYTPVLDSLAQNSLFYPNCYGAGYHTHNGIFSSIFGLPTLGNLKVMSSSVGSNYTFSGLSNILSNYGYSSIYLCTNSKNFDNAGAFLSTNDFDLIIDRDYYKDEDIVDNWGVGDHTLFSYTFPVIDSVAEKSPFFAVYMTVSTHIPYVLPEGISFTPKSKSKLDIIYEYADWSIGQFLEQASSKPWYDSTIFVFVADHGQNFDVKYEVPLAYHHIPLMFFSPQHITPDINTGLAMQIDIPTTVMSILGLPYINNTMGIDLQKQERPYAYFCSDKNTACISDSLYYIKNSSGVETLYKYKEKSLFNYNNDYANELERMKIHTYSGLQTTQYMIYNNKVSLPRKN